MFILAKTYTMEIAGVKRELPLCPVSDKLDIAAFILFGDVEVTVKAAEELLKKCPEFDYILTPEAKSIPLAYEMSRQSGKKYFVARKKPKVYMTDPVCVSVRYPPMQSRLFFSAERTEISFAARKYLSLTMLSAPANPSQQSLPSPISSKRT